MIKIATHNSVTGERGRGIISHLVSLFSKCQNKTIKEQFDSGCRYFDIRCRKNKKTGEWYGAHGLWTSKKSLLDILKILEFLPEKVYIMLTYEGNCSDDVILKKGKEINRDFKNIILTSINIKKPEWKCIKTVNLVPLKREFIRLDGSDWHTILPIPILWKLIYYPKPIFSKDIYTIVDFL